MAKARHDSIHQGVAGVLEIFAAEGLGYERVHAEQRPCGENCQHVVESFSQASCADGNSAIGQAPDHDGVDDAHAHPAQFGEGQRQCQAQRRHKLLAQTFYGHRGAHGAFLKWSLNNNWSRPGRTQMLRAGVEFVSQPCPSAVSGGILPCRDVAQPGRALAWGARGRQFKSARPDQIISRTSSEIIGRLSCSPTQAPPSAKSMILRCPWSTLLGNRSHPCGLIEGTT